MDIIDKDKVPFSKIGSAKFPELQEDFPHSPKEEIDQALKTLQANKKKWIDLSLDRRIVILEKINRDLSKISDRWVNASLKKKGIPPRSTGEGEEWIVLAIAFRTVRLLRESLQNLKLGEGRQLSEPKFTKIKNQVIAKVFPQNLYDRLLFKGISGEIWMKPGLTLNEVVANRSKIYKNMDQPGGVCLVLAAGNVADLAIMDCLYKLLIENRVVVLKTNPVNAYLGPLYQECFSALINEGFLRIVYGGTEEGTYLCNHPDVDELHLTGSDKTYDAVVFGPGPEGEKRKKGRNPLLKKRFTAELGNITPVIIVPGPWSERDIQGQALQISSWLAVNAGFNCLTPRVIIQQKNWDKRGDLNKAISNVLKKIAPRKAYYPGAKQRHGVFVAAHPDSHQFGDLSEDFLPWTFITDLDPNEKDDICFNSEAFCSLFAETALEASDIPEFIDQAVKFANNTLWGTLAASIMVHPKSLKNPEIAAAVNRAVADLKYGSVCLNLRTEFAYYLRNTTWGAFPGHDIYDIQSGTGVVGNTMMFEQPQKSVIRGPFRMSPNPFVVTSKQFFKFGKKMARFEAKPSWWKLPEIFWLAKRS